MRDATAFSSLTSALMYAPISFAARLASSDKAYLIAKDRLSAFRFLYLMLHSIDARDQAESPRPRWDLLTVLDQRPYDGSSRPCIGRA